MAKTYTATQGEAWDGIAYTLYGDEKYMKELIEANWRLLDTLVFSGGEVLNVPEIPTAPGYVDGTPFWLIDEQTGETTVYESGIDEQDDDY